MAQYIIDISNPNDGQGDPLRFAFDQVNQMFTELYTNKVDKESGKGLSSNDFTDLEQTKLAGIEDGAEVNVQSDLLQDDDTQDDHIKNREAFGFFRTAPQIQTYAGVNTFNVPNGSIVDSVMLVRTMLWETDEWTQTGNVVTITKAMTTGNRIQFNFF